MNGHFSLFTGYSDADVVHEVSSVEGHSEHLPGLPDKKKAAPYRPGLSAGISGTAYADTMSTTSNASSAAPSGASGGRSRKDMR